MEGDQRKTIHVRIAVAVSENGDYSANGWRSKGKDAGDEAAVVAEECYHPAVATGLQIRWVEAFVPAYERNEPTVIGTVVEEVPNGNG